MDSEANFSVEMGDFDFESDIDVSTDEQSSNVRFEHVDEAQKEAFKLKQKNENTERKTRSDVKLFKEYLAFKKDARKPEDIPGSDLNALLEEFFMCVRKTDKSEYEPSTLRGMLGRLKRYLEEKEYSENIMTSPNFAGMREMLNAKYKVRFYVFFNQIYCLNIHML